ncbi:MAG: aminomethyl-transferring glycine dehydrogenase subunit GcvPB [Candidatus Hinthialibacter antarcticus]|nr:aminomethyl-transferring glycine dehydrogenase subunit GcvPB [Candidatus Hinthialibacter antarcticus]
MPLDAFEPTLFELSSENEGRSWLPQDDGAELDALLPTQCLNADMPSLPIVAELDVVRHFTKLSRRNFCIESGFYPLGSCTMKYNPKICDSLASLPGFANLHPQADADMAQGTLGLMDDISDFLEQLSGMDKVTTNPCAGAHGEFCGMLLVRAYHRDQGSDRDTVLVPDSAHGTNPATAAMVGYKTLEVKSNAEGCVDLDDLKSKLNDNVAALMLTNPNTLGLFEKDILEIAKVVHDAGALLYYDGANLNAIAGVARPGDMGFDVVHINLHKTFSTPHGGGGPGAGPVGVKSHLVPYLPIPLIENNGGKYALNYESKKSIGQLSTFFGNTGIVLRAYVYMRMHGAGGIRQNSVHAVLNARYLKYKLKDLIPAEIDADNMHEFVLTLKDKKRFGDFNAMAFAKNLIDRGYHAPTVYFPLIVKEALMIEPTETESKRTLDEFAAVVADIMAEAKADPEKALHAPYTTPVRKLDEVTAARQPVLTQPCLE